MQKNKINIFTCIIVLLVLQLISSKKGGLTLSEQFLELSCLTISNSLKPWIDCSSYLETVGHGQVYEYTLRNNYPFLACPCTNIFKQLYIHIIAYILIYLAPALFLCKNLFDFSLAQFLIFAINFILLVRNKTKKYLPVSHRIINYHTFLACIIVYRLIQGLHQYFQIVIYTDNSLYFIYLTSALFQCNNPLDFSLAQFFVFAMNFILLVRNKTKKYLPVSHRIINYQTFLACITVYQLIQGQCSHSVIL